MNMIKKNFWKYISLGILGMLGSAGTILADAYFVSDKLGATGLASMNIAMCAFGLMNGTGLLFGVGGATRYTLLKSRGNKTEANKVFVLAFFTALTIGGIFLLAGLLFSKEISYLLGANEDTIFMCNLYLKTILCFAPAFVLNHLLMAFVRNDDDPGLSMRAMMIGSLTNIVFDYIFMYWIELGIFGAAFATGLAALVGIGISCLHFSSNKNHLQFVYTEIKLQEICNIIFLGISSFITEFSSGVVLVVFNLLILDIAGNTGVAAYGIVANLALMILAIMNGISLGIQPLISKMYGTGHDKIAKYLYQKGLILTFIIGVIVFITTYTFSPALVLCFNSGGDDALQILAERGVQLYFIGFLFVGYNYLTSAYFNAMEKPRQAFIIASFRGFIGIITTVCVLAVCFDITGIWLSFPIVEFITILLGLFLQFKSKILGYHIQPTMRVLEVYGELLKKIPNGELE